MDTQRIDPSDASGGLQDNSWLEEMEFDRTVIGQDAHALIQAHIGLRLKTPYKEMVLHLSPILIGRDASCNLQLPSRMVSRHHAVIYKAGKHHVIRDLHSTNGVALNGTSVLRSVIRAGDTLKLGDQVLQVTEGPMGGQHYAESCVVIFVDLENSTAMSLKYGDHFAKDMQAEMQKLEDQVLIHLGSPVKHLGDGIMCAFGLWPVEQPNYHAVDQALRFARTAVKHFQKLENYPPLRIRVGMHWGTVVVSDRAELDLYGDTVNTASRLEAANKAYGTQIMVSEELRSRSKLTPCLREVDTVRVQGRDEPVTVFVWDEEYVKTRQDGHRKAYEEALALYRKGDLNAAALILEGAQANDPLCKPLLERIRSISSLPENWDGIWSLSKE